MTNKRSFISWIGLLLSFIGMAGLVLSIVSLLPVNVYNMYLTTLTVLKLVEFEKENWFYQDAQIYLIFLAGSFVSSLFEIFTTFLACAQTGKSHQVMLDQESCNSHNNSSVITKKKSWFIRIICFTLLIQILFSILGAHIIYKIKSENIPLEIQQEIFLSCAILWINYLSLTVFCFILLFASFFILIGQQPKKSSIIQSLPTEETRPLIIH
ncbi:hypothetical protein BD770DRAFT_384142 [Pilaira anomala]|nr:hypothetical protein BD770DRAFT_384142 [Pilaira anomala]